MAPRPTWMLEELPAGVSGACSKCRFMVTSVAQPFVSTRPGSECTFATTVQAASSLAHAARQGPERVGRQRTAASGLLR